METEFVKRWRTEQNRLMAHYKQTIEALKVTLKSLEQQLRWVKQHDVE